MSERETLAAYDRQADHYLRMVSDWNDPCLTAFITAMPVGGKVLDFGCGPGHTAAKMAKAGLSVTATDGSAEMIQLAKQHPGVTARLAVFEDLRDQEIYDGIWASFSLLHAPRADFPNHLKALHRAAKPGGRLHLSMKLGSGEATDKLGRFYSYYSQEELEKLLADAGFAVGSHITGATEGLAGGIEDWIAITAHA